MKKELAEQKEAMKVCMYAVTGGVVRLRDIMSKTFRDHIEDSCCCICAGLIGKASLTQC